MDDLKRSIRKRRRPPVPDSKPLADAVSMGRTQGMRDALLMLGLGIGLGLAGALTPTAQAKPEKCRKLIGCRHDAGHEGDCEPEKR